jgi:hypothetical protein
VEIRIDRILSAESKLSIWPVKKDISAVIGKKFLLKN